MTTLKDFGGFASTLAGIALCGFIGMVWYAGHLDQRVEVIEVWQTDNKRIAIELARVNTYMDLMDKKLESLVTDIKEIRSRVTFAQSEETKNERYGNN